MRVGAGGGVRVAVGDGVRVGVKREVGVMLGVAEGCGVSVGVRVAVLEGVGDILPYTTSSQGLKAETENSREASSYCTDVVPHPLMMKP